MISVDRETYYRLLKECNPDDYFRWIKEDMVSDIESYDPESAEEVERWIDCTSSWIKRYEKFASGQMTDRELYKFYADTLKMFDEGIRARRYQMELTEDELIEAEEEYADGYISDEEYEEIKNVVEWTKKALNEDIELLKSIKSQCLGAEDKLGVVTCIETVASVAHERGSMLPVMCGAYLPEDVVESVMEYETWEAHTRPEDVGYELSQATQSVFECIKEFR